MWCEAVDLGSLIATTEGGPCLGAAASTAWQATPSFPWASVAEQCGRNSPWGGLVPWLTRREPKLADDAAGDADGNSAAENLSALVLEEEGHELARHGFRDCPTAFCAR